MKESSLKKDIVIIFLIALAVLGMLFLQRGKFAKIKAGSPAPLFTATDINGNKISLSELKGKVVLINFWATWCSPCKEEIPELIKLAKLMRGQNFIILAISEDNKDIKEIRDFAKTYKMNFPVLTDPSRTIGGNYHIGGVPETFLVNKEGKLIYKFIGPKNWTSSEMISIFKKLINQKHKERKK